MHKQGLIHRDIKPENILIKEGNIIKICDFGWCVQTDANQQRNTFCGTLEYMAPEMIQNKAHNHTLDVWSLGILLYELVHGRAPFTGVHPREISDKIMRGNIRFKPGLSDEYKDLVTSILKYETTERIPLIKVFDHPWVKNFEKKYNLSKVAPAKPIKDKELEKKKAQKAAETAAVAEAAAAAAMKAEEQKRLEDMKRFDDKKRIDDLRRMED
jgi:serine/threonine protein kinase